MRLSLSGCLWLALGALLLGCTGPDDHRNTDYLRDPSFFRADTAVANHPFCDHENPFGSPEACRQARKYKLSWLRPEDTVNFQGYRVYLDTAPEDKKWNTIKDHPELASVIVHSHASKDSIIFAFTKERKPLPDTMDGDHPRIVLLDSNGREEPGTGNLTFALVPVYGGGGKPGRPQFSFFKTTDKDPPDVFHPDFRPLAHGFAIAWERPTDRVSFFDPSQDTGIISGYRLEVAMSGRQPDQRRLAFHPAIESYRIGDSVRTADTKDSVILKDGKPDKVLFFLPDLHRSAKHTRTDISDSMHLELSNLQPQDTLTLKLWALDSAGNSNEGSMEKLTLRTTDTTQPSMPRLSVENTGRNGFTIVWSASRDSAVSSKANSNIREYQLTRVQIRAPGEKAAALDRVDSTIQVDSGLAKRDTVRIRVRFLPPGTAFHVSLYAEDSSGFRSKTDSLTVTTLAVAFADSDSALTCPPGFIPVPRGTFTLGDEASTDADEHSGKKRITMEPYCIEPYEHRDSTGQRFVSGVTYDEAEAMCEAMVDDKSFESELCSEAEWERACEGPDSTALPHGIQSEGNDPSILQTSCNQATNDSSMAMNFALRNSVCLTTEGVYDMAGNLSEWVRDTYAPKAYDAILKDTTLGHGFTFADSGESAPRSIRGGNYLRPNLNQQSRVQSLARCSNRDFPQQVRPLFRPDCVSDDRPMVAVVYGPGVSGYRCLELIPELIGKDISEIVPAPKDTFAVWAFVRGQAEPIRYDFKDKADTAFKGRKPISALLTTRALAEVVFEKAGSPGDTVRDFLDATEMRDTSQAGLEKIFRREALNPQWSVRKVDGKYDIRFHYAYTVSGTKPAKPYYASRAIGFRCCAKAKRPGSPAVAGNP
jgi:formylglycine-generating enzyme required for sulfatase activity